MQTKLVSLLIGTASLAVAADVPEGKLELVIGDLAVMLESSAGWTIRSVKLGGEQLIRPAGGQGAVVLPKNGKFIGSCMNKETPEPVTALSVTVDGKEVAPPFPASVSGQRAVVSKTSALGALAHTAETTIEDGLIVQRHRFAAQQDTYLKTFYAFIYSFVPSAISWRGKTLGGDMLEGTFLADKGHVPSQLCRWLAQYDPDTGNGMIAYLPTPVAGRGAFTRFWDTESYHKLLVQPQSGAIEKGGEWDLTLVMRFFAAQPEAWTARVDDLAAKLAKRFPPKPVPAAVAQSAGVKTGRLYGEGVPETGKLVCKAGKYTITFAAERAWTIYDMKLGEVTFSGSNGFYGQVMTPKGGRWWGTGHQEGGKEVVHALTLTVDGEERPVKVGDTVSGKKITLLKSSTIWKFKALVEVTITPEHVFERARLEAFEDCELSTFYYFMHCFPPNSTKWLGELENGDLAEGPLAHAGNMQVNKNTRWLAQYQPDTGLGILCYTPRIVKGNKSRSMIWDLERYHKYYIQQNKGQAFTAGEKMDYSVIVKAVENETGDWTATKAAVAELKKEFPPGEPGK